MKKESPMLSHVKLSLTFCCKYMLSQVTPFYVHRRSFPSAHASCSMYGMLFLAVCSLCRFPLIICGYQCGKATTKNDTREVISLHVELSDQIDCSNKLTESIGLRDSIT